MVVHDFELALSDPSDAHTNSTIAISDDTDVKSSEGIHQDLNVTEHQENEVEDHKENYLDFNFAKTY